MGFFLVAVEDETTGYQRGAARARETRGHVVIAGCNEEILRSMNERYVHDQFNGKLLMMLTVTTAAQSPSYHIHCKLALRRNSECECECDESSRPRDSSRLVRIDGSKKRPPALEH